MSADSVRSKLRTGRRRHVHRGVYATFTGRLPRQAQLWAAVLYAGSGAVLSHESAGELQHIVDQPSSVIHVTVPASRRVTPVPGLVIHISDQPARLDRYPAGQVPVTLVEDTIIDLAEAADNLDAVYGWVTRAFGRTEIRTSEALLLATVKGRAKLRWRSELNEAIVAGAAGAHSPLEFRWDRDVERAHGLPVSKKQVRFTKKDGTTGFRDRVFEEWRLVIELDGSKAHPPEAAGADQARDRQAAAGDGSLTMRYGWREVRYEACDTTVEVVRVLWQRGWRERPRPCSPACPVTGLLKKLDAWLAKLTPARLSDQGWAQQGGIKPVGGARLVAARDPAVPRAGEPTVAPPASPDRATSRSGRPGSRPGSRPGTGPARMRWAPGGRELAIDALQIPSFDSAPLRYLSARSHVPVV